MRLTDRFADPLLIAADAGLTAIWLSLWVNWLVRLASLGPPPPWYWPIVLGLAGALGAAATRLTLHQSRWTARRARTLVSVAGVLAVLVMVWLALGAPLATGGWQAGPHLIALIVPAGPAFAAGLVIWRRGIYLGRDAISHHTLSGAFSNGLLGLGFLLAANSLNPVLPSGALLANILLFFALGLGGLALGSLRRLSLRQRAAALAQVALHRDWLLTAAAVITVVIIAGLGLASVLAPEAIQRLVASLGGAVERVWMVVALLIAPFALLTVALMERLLPGVARAIVAVIEAIREALLRLAGFVGALLRFISPNAAARASVERFEAFINLPAVQVTGRWASLAGVLLVLAIIFWLAVRRLGILRSLDEDEQRENILSSQLLLAQLKQLFRRRPAAAPPAQAYLTLSGSPDDARLIVRQAYQAMLEWAQSIRLPRAAGQTPRSYARLLAGAVPEAHDAIDILTQAYVQARYADEAPPLELARSAAGAAAELRALRPPAGRA